jgi:hypothetical protein
MRNDLTTAEYFTPQKNKPTREEWLYECLLKDAERLARGIDRAEVALSQGKYTETTEAILRGDAAVVARAAENLGRLGEPIPAPGYVFTVHKGWKKDEPSAMRVTSLTSRLEVTYKHA